MALQSRLQLEDLDTVTYKRFILWYTMLGNVDTAHGLASRMLDHFARSGSVGSTWAFIWLREMKPFRQHPRFQTFVDRMGFMPYWEQYGPPDDHVLRDGRVIAVD